MRKIVTCLLAACGLAAMPAAAFFANPRGVLVEYYNEITGHYALLDESGVVDSGGAGPDWHRTGHELSTWWLGWGRSVCRFYSPVFNSHFYTADPGECQELKQPGGNWIFEGLRFAVEHGCTAQNKPVYRLYNNRFAFGDVNHRFTADAAVRDAMVAKGWLYEGIAFCVEGAGIAPEKSFEVDGAWSMLNEGQAAIPKQQCAARVGPCLALDQLRTLPNRVDVYLPPRFIERNPQYPVGVAQIIGEDTGIVWTTESDPFAITSRSFAQVGYNRFGLYINGADRLSGSYAGMSPMYTLPGLAPPAGGVDERVFPWREKYDRRVTIGAHLRVKTLQRASSGAHAYGGALVQFADKRSGRSFYMTLQAFGSVPPGDFAGADARNGWAIVSTAFRADPAFGQRLAGSFAACGADPAVACVPERSEYKFQLRRADFEEILRRARTVDPALSLDAADYFVAAFGFHVETYLDARLGLTVDGVRLELMQPDRPEF